MISRCIVVQLTKFSFQSLIFTPCWIFENIQNMITLLWLQVQHLLPWSNIFLILMIQIIFIHIDVLHLKYAYGNKN